MWWGIRVFAAVRAGRRGMSLLTLAVFVFSILSGLIGFSGAAGMARADVIRLRADQWCPFNCIPGSLAPGFMIELAREALAPFGHQIDYANLSWARSQVQVQTGEINGLIGTDDYEMPDLIFGPPLGQYQEALVFRTDEARPVTTPEDLQGLRLGALQGYEYNDLLQEYVTTHQSDATRVQLLSGENRINRNLRKLLNHRVDVLLGEYSVLLYALHTQALRDRVDLILLPEEASPLYIGFSPALDSSPLYAAQLSAGIRRLKHTGRYDQIMARYGLVD